MKNCHVLCLLLYLSSLLIPAIANAQEFTVLDTVYTPAGYTDGSGLASVYIPRVGNGIGVVLVHGCGNDRTEPRAWCDTLAAYGYVAMAIEYPDPCLTLSAVYPQKPRAAKLAVEFLRRNAERFGITTRKIVGVGMSNGAATWGEAIVWDNDDAYFQTDSTIDDRLDAAILLYGYYDDTPTSSADSIYWDHYFSGDTLRSIKGNCLKNIDNITTPILLLHGLGDGVVPYQASQQFHDSLTARGKTSELVLFPGQPHAFDVNWPTLTAFTPAGLVAKDTALAFLKRIVKPSLRMHLYNRSIYFGNKLTGERDTAYASLTNIGIAPLSVTSIANSHPQFSMLNLPAFPATVPPGGSLEFRAEFHPSAAGIALDTIRIASDDSLNPAEAITLRGKGVAVISPAGAGVLYSTSGSMPEGYLCSLNSSSGSVDTIGAMGTPVIHGMAIRQADNIIFGSSAGATSTSLFQISALSGDAVPVRTLPIGNLRAIAFGPGDTLYGATTTGTLYRINVTDGHVDSLGTMRGLKYLGLTFRPGTHQLWASVSFPIDSIFTLNTQTGAATFVGVTGFNALTSSLAFDHLGNLLGLIDNGSGEDYLATIDTGNGAGTIIAGPLPTGNLQAIAIRTDQGTTSVHQGREEKIPLSYGLSQNYPNPFNPVTTIGYALPKGEHVKLSVFNVLGEEVATLVDEVQAAGFRSVSFNADRLPSGMYFYRMMAGTYIEQRKLLLIR